MGELETTKLETPSRQAPDSLMLYGFWYRALPGAQASRNRLHKAMLLETPLVIGRDRQGKAFALRDACPHRGMPLSCGRFDGQDLGLRIHRRRDEGVDSGEGPHVEDAVMEPRDPLLNGAALRRCNDSRF